MVKVSAQVDGKLTRKRPAPHARALAGHGLGRCLRRSKDGALRLSSP
jgi:hypothetical protein